MISSDASEAALGVLNACRMEQGRAEAERRALVEQDLSVRLSLSLSFSLYIYIYIYMCVYTYVERLR